MTEDSCIDPDLIDTRTPEERELDLLNGWLCRRNWCLGPGPNMIEGYSEAACLLAGIDPELTMGGPGDFGWKFLPGALENFGFNEYPRDKGGRWELDTIIIEYLDLLAGLKPLGTARVEVIIVHALEAGLFIPWLAAARADTECAKHLPDSAFKGEPTQKLGPAGNAVSRSSSKKATDRWKNDPKTVAINEIGKPMFEKWFNVTEIPKSSRADLVRRILEELCKEFPEDDEPRVPRTIERYIQRWTQEREI